MQVAASLHESTYKVCTWIRPIWIFLEEKKKKNETLLSFGGEKTAQTLLRFYTPF